MKKRRISENPKQGKTKKTCIMKKMYFIFLFALVAFSCNQDEGDLSMLKNQAIGYEDFFEKVASMNLKTDKENVIYIDYEWNASDKTITYIGSEEKEPSMDIGVALALLETERKSKNKMDTKGYHESGSDYQVSCDNGDGSWDSPCKGVRSCGKLIAKCLEEGGCATICRQQMVYAPEDKVFFLVKE